MKIYKLTTNTGDWNGIHTEYVLAESKEEAIAKNEWYRTAPPERYDHWIGEIDGNRLLQYLLSCNDPDRNEYTMDIIIRKKSDARAWIHWTDDYKDYVTCPCCEYGSEGEVLLADKTPFCPICGADLRRGDSNDK